MNEKIYIFILYTDYPQLCIILNNKLTACVYLLKNVSCEYV